MSKQKTFFLYNMPRYRRNNRYCPMALKNARWSRAMLYAELAKEANIQAEIIAEMEADERLITEADVRKFAEILEYPESFFEEDMKHPHTAQPIGGWEAHGYEIIDDGGLDQL